MLHAMPAWRHDAMHAVVYAGAPRSSIGVAARRHRSRSTEPGALYRDDRIAAHAALAIVVNAQHKRTNMPVAALTLFFLFGTARGLIVLPSIYGSHMVVQAGQEGEFWGMASPSAKVDVKIGGGAPLTATASVTGRFSVTLPAMPASMSPVTITVTSGSDSLVLSDVCVYR